MRKLWPPTYDDVSVRFWAAAVSVSANLALVSVLYLHLVCLEILFLYGPALFSYTLVSALVNRGIESDSVSWLGLIAATLVNLGFYYFVSWWLISAFRPARSWWPEKRV